PLRLRYRHANFSPFEPRWELSRSDNSFEREKRLRHRFERSAMDRARAEFMELQQVQFGAITFVLAETILGKLAAKVTHHPVASYFGDDAGRSDGQTDAIAV